MWYSLDENTAINLTAVDVERVKQIIELNKKGILVETLTENKESQIVDILDYKNFEKNTDSIKKTGNNKKKRHFKKQKPFNTKKPE